MSSVRTSVPLAALLTERSLSDHLGHRPVLLDALVLETAAMAVLVLADSATTLMVARLVRGVVTGTTTGALADAIGLVPTAAGYAGMVLLLALVVLLGLLRNRPAARGSRTAPS